ncbi:MAG TPA: hypothetical protein PK225_03580 [Azonexus sp.]|jgi:hypothetical protein|nr:hypothetical protein [Azonexus sp.]
MIIAAAPRALPDDKRMATGFAVNDGGGIFFSRISEEAQECQH